VLRFAGGEIDFHAAAEEKEKEEAIVHNLTKNTLQAARHKDMDLVLECFSNNFKILDI
jgi:hypothetical protein